MSGIWRNQCIERARMIYGRPLGNIQDMYSAIFQTQRQFRTCACLGSTDKFVQTNCNKCECLDSVSLLRTWQGIQKVWSKCGGVTKAVEVYPQLGSRCVWMAVIPRLNSPSCLKIDRDLEITKDQKRFLVIRFLDSG